jgi:hypothetical protein
MQRLNVLHYLNKNIYYLNDECEYSAYPEVLSAVQGLAEFLEVENTEI